MSKKIIICCDGTGNEIQGNQSNVLKLFHLLDKRGDQVCYYDPGVGTISDSSAWSKFKSKARGVFGLMTGAGLDANVLDAYKFLMRNYEWGDKIYLFGFSRGAYTVRVLAGFIKMIGILKGDYENLATYALAYYKRSGEKNDARIAYRFNQIIPVTRATIEFMGCWDTVGSVIIPRFDRFYAPFSLENPPHVNENSAVKVFRHALAIDERRRMFRVARWQEPQKYKLNPFLRDDSDKIVDQDIKQVWFSGVHSDVGGGYPEDESGAAKIALKWMVDEAIAHGLKFKMRSYSLMVEGKNSKRYPDRYSAPDPNADLHDSMNFAWRLLEIIPKWSGLKDWPKRISILGLYIPWSEPRFIEPGATIDPSVRERKKYTKDGADYDPVNVPK